MKINLLQYNDQIIIKNEDALAHIYCIIRKKYLILTPEEHVRQLMLIYLIKSEGYKSSTISVEKTIRINNLSKRPDILVYNKKGLPYLVIECKAPQIRLDEKTIQQVGFYNSKLNCPYAMIVNGQSFFTFKIHDGHISQEDIIPPPPT